MAASDITRGVGWEDEDATFLARLTLNGSNITQSVISSIQRKIFDLDGPTPTTATDTTSLTVASAIFNTLQTDGRWTVDGTGYNFRDNVVASFFPSGDRRYRIEYKFTGSSGEVFFAVFEWHPREVLSS